MGWTLMERARICNDGSGGGEMVAQMTGSVVREKIGTKAVPVGYKQVAG